MPPCPQTLYRVAIKLQDKRGHILAALEVTGDRAWEIGCGKESWGLGGEVAFPLNVFFP